MNRIVREHVRVADLPPDWRPDLPDDAEVTVTIEPKQVGGVGHVRDFSDVWALRRNTFESINDVVSYVRKLRDDDDEG